MQAENSIRALRFYHELSKDLAPDYFDGTNAIPAGPVCEDEYLPIIKAGAFLESVISGSSDGVSDANMDLLARYLAVKEAERFQEQLSELIMATVPPMELMRRVNERAKELKEHGIDISPEIAKGIADRVEERLLKESKEVFLKAEEMYWSQNLLDGSWAELPERLRSIKTAEDWLAYKEMLRDNGMTGNFNQLCKTSWALWVVGEKGLLSKMKEEIEGKDGSGVMFKWFPYTQLLYHALFNKETVTMPEDLNDIGRFQHLLQFNIEKVVELKEQEEGWNYAAYFIAMLGATYLGCIAAGEAESLAAAVLTDSGFMFEGASLFRMAAAGFLKFEANVMAFEVASTAAITPLLGWPDDFNEGLIHSNGIFLGLGVVGRGTRLIEGLRLKKLLGKLAQDLDLPLDLLVQAGISPASYKVESYFMHFSGTYAWLQGAGLYFNPVYDDSKVAAFFNAESAANLGLLILMNNARGRKAPFFAFRIA